MAEREREPMIQSIIIVDDFYDDAPEVRRRALRLDYPDDPEGKAYYAGRNSRLMLMNDRMIKVFSRLVGHKLVPSPDSANGHFRVSLAGDRARQDIHVDPGRDWGGVLYLNPPEQCRGGTSFFRHKELGIEAMPLKPEEIRSYGYRDYEHMRRSIVETDGQDRGRWDLTMTVPMRFNRLVLFRSNLWHSFAENFGDSVENARLIQVFFFDYADTRPHRPSFYELANRG